LLLALLVAALALAVALVLLWPVEPAPPDPGPAPTPPAEVKPPAYTVPAGRSPIPHEGETVTTPLPAKQIEPPREIVADVPPPEGVVPWTEAGRYLGHEITTEGKIVATKDIGSLCFLNFTDEPRGGDKFYIVIFKEAYAAYPNGPEKDLLGKTLQVTGKVSLHKDRPQMQVRDAKQVKVVE
jgi:hypothetical protein